NRCVTITVTFADDSVLQAQSSSQYEFMLPWGIQRGNSRVDAFNRDISRAVVALLPENSTNRERLNGDGFVEVLGSAVMDEIRNNGALLYCRERGRQVVAASR